MTSLLSSTFLCTGQPAIGPTSGSFAYSNQLSASASVHFLKIKRSVSNMTIFLHFCLSFELIIQKILCQVYSSTIKIRGRLGLLHPLTSIQFHSHSSNIFSIKIPYPLVGSLTNTCVTAPMIFPSCRIGLPLIPCTIPPVSASRFSSVT